MHNLVFQRAKDAVILESEQSAGQCLEEKPQVVSAKSRRNGYGIAIALPVSAAISPDDLLQGMAMSCYSVAIPSRVGPPVLD